MEVRNEASAKVKMGRVEIYGSFIFHLVHRKHM